MFGRSNTGRGQRGGMGFGFRGSSPPWPYVGRGRGGLPRCGYYLGSQANLPSIPTCLAPEQEINFLRGQAETIRKELEMVESRLRDMEAGK